MSTIIIKLQKDGKDYYMEWSESVDAPTTRGLTLEELKQYYLEEYGRYGMRELPRRLERVERKGVSSHVFDNAEEVISYNRAGKGESLLTIDEIFETYCF